MKANDFLRRSAALLAACMTVSVCGICAAAEEEETEESEPEYASYTCGDYTYHRVINAEDESQKAACLDAYTGADHELVIPEEVDGLPVVMLGDYIFTENYNLDKVTLPDSLEYIGTYAFADCTNIKEYVVKATSTHFAASNGAVYSDDFEVLYRYPTGCEDTEFTVQNGVTTIGSCAFTCSKYLTSITLPDSLETIESTAFSQCSALESIVIPEGVKTIGEFAFNSCEKLKNVTLPETLTEIGNGAFAATAIEEITLPSLLTSVGEQAFAATKMKEVHIPPSVTDIGYSAFGWDVDLTGELITVDDFTIYGAANSSASAYASDSYAGNKFNFVAEYSAETQPASDGSDEPASGMSAGRIVGIAVCCVLLVAIVVFAVITDKKLKKGESGDDKTN